MGKLEAVRLALAELGDATSEELATFVQARYGVEVQPSLVPIIRATLRDKEILEQARASRAATGAVTATAPAPAAVAVASGEQSKSAPAELGTLTSVQGHQAIA